MTAPLAVTEVFGIARGSFADYAAARADRLVAKPARLSFEQAAVVAVSGLAALKGLHAGRIAAGQKVLIIGASGGVGTYAVQLSKAFGAMVTGMASTAKVDLVRSIGADQVIDYTREDWADGRQHFDAGTFTISAVLVAAGIRRAVDSREQQPAERAGIATSPISGTG